MPESIWKLDVHGALLPNQTTFTMADFEKMADPDFKTDPYLDDETAEVVPFHTFLRQLNLPETPSHVVFSGSDQFIAEIRFEELFAAFFLFKSKGRPLEKAFPVRLYVPDGASNCMNVKSIVQVELRKYEGKEKDKETDFGFRNIFKPEELIKRSRSNEK